jgi:hypothetical protein
MKMVVVVYVWQQLRLQTRLCLTWPVECHASLFDAVASCACARWLLLSLAFVHKISLVDLFVFVGLVNTIIMSMLTFVVDCCVYA